MKIIKQRVAGVLIADGGRVALRLEDGSQEVYLTYALTTQGIAARVIPGVLLDDWGKQITGLSLYAWVRENGLRFPRAEVFGYTPDGENVQYFLRDMELFAAYPVYASTDSAAPIAQWLPLRAVVIANVSLSVPQSVEVPATIEGPLRNADVNWWHVPLVLDDLDFLEARESPPE